MSTDLAIDMTENGNKINDMERVNSSSVTGLLILEIGTMINSCREELSTPMELSIKANYAIIPVLEMGKCSIPMATFF